MKIASHTIQIIPRYCETDQAGVVHHSAYPVYFEMGRTELLRANGYAYKDLEKQGHFMVVVELNIRYRRAAFYDETLDLTTVCTLVNRSKIIHEYQLVRPATGIVLAGGSSTLACVDAAGKLARVPEFLYPEK